MKIFVNKDNCICDVGSTTDSTLTEYTVDDDMFSGWSVAKICCYKVYIALGQVCGFTPYVDSRLIEHIDQLGKSTEVNAEDISATMEGLTETYENVGTNADDIAICMDAITEIYEMLGE